MPGTDEEIVALVESIVVGAVDAAVPLWIWGDGTGIDERERRDVLALAEYLRGQREQRRVARSKAQQKAMALLRSLLSADQAATLRRRGHFRVRAGSGATYRLDPRFGMAERVEQHGRRWYARTAFCLHDAKDGDKMPPADVTVGHLLLILADEPIFLATANHNRRDDQLWNREYLARMRNRQPLEMTP